MDDPSASEDIFRPWKLTPEEKFEEMCNSVDGWANSTPAWQHFEEFFAARGYDLRYYLTPRGLRGDPEQEYRRPMVDIDGGLGNPFKPDINKPLPFVFHHPAGFSQAFEYDNTAWMIRYTRLISAYDKYNRIVVIKALPIPDGNTEVEILKALNSEQLRSSPENHAIPLLEHIVSDEGWQFLVMPAWRMRWESYFKAWDVDDYFNVAVQFLEGLAFIHKNGFAHCDLSIQNLVFNQDGTVDIDAVALEPIISRWDFRVAIIDFGLSMRFDPQSDSSTWVSSSELGTFPYISPEKLRAEDTGTPFQVLPEDVYASGAALKDIIKTEKETIDRIRKLTIPRVYANEALQWHVPEYQQILDNMMNVDPMKRPTADEALQQLRSIRISLPDHIRFAPSEGYPASLAPSSAGDVSVQ